MLRFISGTNCQTNIDDCKLNDQPCENGATCIDGIADYTCNCMPGYTGRNCTIDIDECQFGFCQNNAACSHTINNYTCHCLPGFMDFNCSTDINECESNPCVNSTNCTDLINDFNCTCLPGFRGNNHYEMKVIVLTDTMLCSTLIRQELDKREGMYTLSGKIRNEKQFRKHPYDSFRSRERII